MEHPQVRYRSLTIEKAKYYYDKLFWHYFTLCSKDHPYCTNWYLLFWKFWHYFTFSVLSVWYFSPLSTLVGITSDFLFAFAFGGLEFYWNLLVDTNVYLVVAYGGLLAVGLLWFVIHKGWVWMILYSWTCYFL